MPTGLHYLSTDEAIERLRRHDFALHPGERYDFIADIQLIELLESGQIRCAVDDANILYIDPSALREEPA